MSLFTACSGNEETQQPLQWVSHTATGFKVYKKGVFFVDKNGILQYFDAASKKTVVLCDKKDCQHSGKSCHGYIGSAYSYNVSGSKIYTLNDEDSLYTLIESDIDFTNHKETVTLGKELSEEGFYIDPMRPLVSGDYIYYVTEVSNFNTGESYYGIYGANLKTGKEATIIDHMEQGTLDIVSVCDSEIIYFTSYLDKELRNEIYGSIPNELDFEEYSKKFKEYEEQRTYRTYKYNIETGETKVLYENKAAALPVFADENYLYAYTYTVYEATQSFVPDRYFTVDLKTQEEKTIDKDEFEKNQNGFSESEADAITGGSEDLVIYCLVDSGYIGTRTDKKVPTGENSYTITGKSYVLIDKNNPQKEPFVFYTLEK